MQQSIQALIRISREYFRKKRSDECRTIGGKFGSFKQTGIIISENLFVMTSFAMILMKTKKSFETFITMKNNNYIDTLVHIKHYWLFLRNSVFPPLIELGQSVFPLFMFGIKFVVQKGPNRI